jgi:regulator of RNase E activity RraA
VAVFPGFYVFADSSGAVVIPDGQVEDVIDGARAVESDDEGYRNEIGQERLPESQRRGPRWSLKRAPRDPTE